MRMSESHSSRPLIAHLTEFQERWSDMSADWNDANSLEFERRYLDPMASSLLSYIRALDELVDAIEEAERAAR